MTKSTHPPSLYEGTLDKIGGSIKTWKTRYFRLYETHLFYYESINQSVNQSKGCILLPGAQLSIYSDDVYPNHPYAFGVTPCNNQREYVFAAQSNEQMIDWLMMLKPLCKATLKTNNQSINQSTNQSNNQTNNQSINQSINQSVKEGYMTKQGGTIKTWKRRWFVLTNNQLQYYKDVSISQSINQSTNQSDKQSINQSIDYLDLSSFTLETEKAEWVFSVKPMCKSTSQPINQSNNQSNNQSPNKSLNQRVYKFCCETEAERESWLSALRQVRAANQ